QLRHRHFRLPAASHFHWQRFCRTRRNSIGAGDPYIVHEPCLWYLQRGVLLFQVRQICGLREKSFVYSFFCEYVNAYARDLASVKKIDFLALPLNGYYHSYASVLMIPNSHMNVAPPECGEKIEGVNF